MGSTIMVARVDNAYDGANWRALGVNNNHNYISRIDGTWITSSMPRTTGWHELTWDSTSGTGMTMAIDGIQVASTAEITQFSTIAIGDWWGTAPHVGSEFIDDITVTVTS